MSKLPISFYVLSESKAQDFLGFICQLTQTALNKSTQSLLILIEDEALLMSVDEALWAYDATSFIPHQCLSTVGKAEADVNSIDENTDTVPVLLGAYLPAAFSGIIINTTDRPINDFITNTSNVQPTRVLEIIQPNPVSTQAGRDKYKRYQQQDYELTHFKV